MEEGLSYLKKRVILERNEMERRISAREKLNRQDY